MTTDDATRLASALQLACQVHRVPWREDLVTSYAMVLDGEDLSGVEDAMREHLRTSRTFPVPADLIAGARSSSVRLRALESWHAISKGKSVAPGDADVAEEALRLCGGRSMLRELLTQDAPHRRREFVEIFGELATRRPSQRRPDVAALVTGLQRQIGGVPEVPDADRQARQERPWRPAGAPTPISADIADALTPPGGRDGR